MQTMKGFGVLEPTVSVGWMETEIPIPGPREAVLEPVAICPCTSDVHSAKYRKAYPNRILGHEAVGRIVAVGGEVRDFRIGDVVAVPAVTPEWQNLEVQDGLHQHAGGPLGSRYLSAKWDGVFAERFKVPDADMNVALVPEGVSLESAVLAGDMVTTGFHGAELADVRYGDAVVVIGIGPVGLMSVLGAVLRGAGLVIGVGNRPITRELAAEYGANHTVSYKDGPIGEQILAITGGRPVDSVIIAGGENTVIAEALRLVKVGGTVANLAGHEGTFAIPSDDAIKFCAHKTVTGGLCPGGRRRLERLLDMIRRGRFQPDGMITHRYHGLEAVEEAFGILAQSPADIVKPLVTL